MTRSYDPRVRKDLDEMLADIKRQVTPENVPLLCRLVRREVEQRTRFAPTDPEYLSPESAEKLLTLLKVFELDWLGVYPPR